MKSKFLMLVVVAALSACNHNDDKGNKNGPGEPNVKSDVFMESTKAMMQMTADDTEPLDISDVEVTSPEDTEPMEIAV